MLGKKKETKIEQFLAVPSKDAHQTEWSKQPKKKLSQRIFAVRYMMLARLKSHCLKKEGSLLTWDTMADIKGTQVYVDGKVF